MAHFSDEFARLAEAEQRLCDATSPLLDAMVSLVERRCRINISEIRITFDRAAANNGFAKANCTIVQATLDTAREVDSDVSELSRKDLRDVGE